MAATIRKLIAPPTTTPAITMPKNADVEREAKEAVAEGAEEGVVDKFVATAYLN